MTRHILAADVGGTKTTVALFRQGGDPRSPAAVETLPSAGSRSFEELVRPFLHASGDPALEGATIAVAGPVVGDRARVTNLPWTLEVPAIRTALGANAVVLVNDLAAVAHALPTLGADELETIREGRPDEDGARAVVAPGTGLGMATLIRAGGGLTVVPSEGGHASFSPIDDLQAELLQFLRCEHDHVSFERVCSGKLGIPNLYRFLADTGRHPEPRWLSEALSRADDPTTVICDAAAAGRCELCAQTVELFLRILGVAASNLALTVLATGGVFLGGGIPPRLVGTIRTSGFLSAFASKGRFSELLGRIPVHVITDPRAGLWGAARHALQAGG